MPSPLPPCSHHSALPWPILEVSLHNSSAQSLNLSCATTFPLGLPKTDQSAAEQSQQHSQAGFGVCRAGHRPRPHHPVCPIKDSSTLLGHPRTSLVEGTHLSVPISTSPPHSLEQVATVSGEGLGGGLTSRDAGLVRGCRGCRDSAASGSGCSERSCKARRAGVVSVGDGWRWWPLGGTVPWVWRGPGAQSRGDMGWGVRQGE